MLPGIAITVTRDSTRIVAPLRQARQSQSCDDVTNVSRAGRHGPTRSASVRVITHADANTNNRGS